MNPEKGYRWKCSGRGTTHTAGENEIENGDKKDRVRTGGKINRSFQKKRKSSWPNYGGKESRCHKKQPYVPLSNF